MALTTFGYDGTVLEGGWSKLSRYLGYAAAIDVPGGFAPTIVSGVDRTIRLAVGSIYKSGVLVTSDATIDVQSPTLASGTRYDTIIVRRDWQTNTTTVVAVAGTASRQIAAGLNQNPGTIEDQPIALSKIVAGQQAPAEVIDLRPLSVLADRTAVGTEMFWPADGALPEGYVEEDGATLDRIKHSALFAVIGITAGAGDGSTTFAVPNAKGKVIVGKDAAQTEFDTILESGGAKTHVLTSAEMPGHVHDIGHNHTASSAAADTWHSHDMGHGHGRNYGATYGGAGNHAHSNNIGDAAAASGGLLRKGWAAGGEASGAAGAHDHSAYIDIAWFAGGTGGATGPHSHGVTVNAMAGNSQSTGGGTAHNNLQPYAVRRVIIKAL